MNSVERQVFSTPWLSFTPHDWYDILPQVVDPLDIILTIANSISGELQ